MAGRVDAEAQTLTVMKSIDAAHFDGAAHDLFAASDIVNMFRTRWWRWTTT